MAQGIKIIIEEGEDIKIEMEGYQGEGCSADYEKFLHMLEAQGVTIVQRKERRKAAAETTTTRQSVSH